MKNLLFAGFAALALAGNANAQSQPLTPSKPFDNFSITVKGGVAAPVNTQAGSMAENFRGVAGLEVRKQLTPTFGLGVEGEAFFNSSTWNKMPSLHNVVDNTYVGLFGAVNLNNLFAGYAGQPRVFEAEVVGGIGWLHGFIPKSQGYDYNDLGVKTGMNFNFNLGAEKAWTIGIKPAILWNMTNLNHTIFSGRAAAFELEAGVTYHFGNSNGTHSFAFYEPDFSEYNNQINALRAEVSDAATANARLANANAALRQQLVECQNRPVPVVTNTVVEETNTLESVRYVFFKIGSSKVTTDQQPNVVMIADYMKNNPESTVEIKGYASKDGNIDFNVKLAKARAESVKNLLVNGYGIKADRIKAEGQGIGEMFKEESWNRVAICIISDN